MRSLLLLIPLLIGQITINAAIAQDACLILAPDDYLAALYPLARFKACSNRPTYLVGLSEIYYTFSGVDNPEQIKRCIEHYQKAKGVTSVLLVGDVNKFPVRWRWWGRWMPRDPYFTGKWSVINGSYHQTEANKELPYAAWLDIGTHQAYTMEVDCTPVSSDSVDWEVRILYADADRADNSHRIDIMRNTLRLNACSSKSVNYKFTLSQSYHLKAEVKEDSIVVSINNTPQIRAALDKLNLGGRGKIGFGSYCCHCSFDNLKVTHDNNTLWDENFNDGVANGFIDAPTMNERNWSVSDLYYADLYTSSGAFDDWNWNKTGLNKNLFGEIEFKLAQYPGAVLNNDHIDFLPDIAVGRLPAYDVSQVEAYVKKVIWYETATQQTDNWFRTVDLYEGTTGGAGYQSNIENFFKGLPDQFTVHNRTWNGTFKNLNDTQRRAVVVNDINQGAGFINYLGHGNTGSWACISFTDSEVKTKLTNSRMLPIIVAGACFTSQFAPIPPGEAYTDINDTFHTGVNSDCQRFPGPPEYPDYAYPRALQASGSPGCIGEDFMFLSGSSGSNGAIAYLGERSAGRDWGNQLTEYFFKNYLAGTTLGKMWQGMIKDYYWAHQLNASSTWNYGPEKWDEGHKFDEPQKFVLFGDPSLRVGGAYNHIVATAAYDGSGGPLTGSKRYRISSDVIVPGGRTLTVNTSASVLFDPGRTLSTSKTSGQLRIDPANGEEVCLIGRPGTPESRYKVRGMRIAGQLRARNGGGILVH